MSSNSENRLLNQFGVLKYFKNRFPARPLPPVKVTRFDFSDHHAHRGMKAYYLQRVLKVPNQVLIVADTLDAPADDEVLVLEALDGSLIVFK